jgi:hypothetical protein
LCRKKHCQPITIQQPESTEITQINLNRPLSYLDSSYYKLLTATLTSPNLTVTKLFQRKDTKDRIIKSKTEQRNKDTNNNKREEQETETETLSKKAIFFS